MATAGPAVLGTFDSEPYFAGLEAGELRVQRCAACGRHQFYPTSVCGHCQGRDLAFVPVGGAGTVVSVTVTRRAPTAEFKSQLPYVVALVALDEGPVVMCRVAGAAAVDDTGTVTVPSDAADRAKLLLEFHPKGAQ